MGERHLFSFSHFYAFALFLANYSLNRDHQDPEVAWWILPIISWLFPRDQEVQQPVCSHYCKSHAFKTHESGPQNSLNWLENHDFFLKKDKFRILFIAFQLISPYGSCFPAFHCFTNLPGAGVLRGTLNITRLIIKSWVVSTVFHGFSFDLWCLH